MSSPDAPRYSQVPDGCPCRGWSIAAGGAGAGIVFQVSDVFRRQNSETGRSIPNQVSSQVAASPCPQLRTADTRETGSPPLTVSAKSAHLPLSIFTLRLSPGPPDRSPQVYSRPIRRPPGNISGRRVSRCGRVIPLMRSKSIMCQTSTLNEPLGNPEGNQSPDRHPYDCPLDSLTKIPGVDKIYSSSRSGFLRPASLWGESRFAFFDHRSAPPCPSK